MSEAKNERNLPVLQADGAEKTTVGNYFVSNYPPFSFWTPEASAQVLERGVAVRAVRQEGLVAEQLLHALVEPVPLHVVAVPDDRDAEARRHVEAGRLDLARVQLKEIRDRGGEGSWPEIALAKAIQSGDTFNY